MVFSIDVQRYELFPTSHPFHMKIFVLKMANAQTLNFVHTKVHRRDFCVQNIFIVCHLLITQKGRCVHVSGTSPLGTSLALFSLNRDLD